ncbi:Cobalamin trafficking protein CblD [Halotydeus destructor]|nr:Cobalamin trafficking protein CblD [Halotydeus destructor]
MISMFRLNRLVCRSCSELKAASDLLRNRTSSATLVSSVNSSTKSPTESDQAAEATESGTTRTTVPYNVPVNPPEREISLFGPKDLRAPLPGNLGLFPQSYRLDTSSRHVIDDNQFDRVSFNPFDNSDVLSYELLADRQVRIIDQILYPQYEEMEQDDEDKRRPNEVLECFAHQCPELLTKDFQELFPARKLGKNVTVVTISQKCKSDMSVWSQEMELEREELMEHFIQMAKDIVGRFNDAGYWADFVDPFSGRPVRGSYTPATLFETDERYRNFGFDIEDLGCCKVIRHHAWGTRAFVGSLFTNAPVDSREVQEVLRTLGHENV